MRKFQVKISNRSPESLRRALKYMKSQKQHLKSKNVEKCYSYKYMQEVVNPGNVLSRYYINVS